MVEDFNAFNYVLKYCRPHMSNYKIFDVNAGTYTDQSIVMLAAEFEDGKMVSDPYHFVIAKEWIIENLENILALVPDDD